MPFPVAPHPDQGLFRKFCKHEQETILKIYRDSFPVVNKLIRKNRGNWHDVEDVFQESMLALSLYCHKAGFTLTVPLVGFIYSISKKIWMKELSKRGKLKLTFRDIREYVNINHPDNPGEEVAFKAHRLMLLWKYLNRLPERARQLLVAHYLEGKSYEQIAKEQDYSGANSAKQQSFKYIRRLRKMAKEDPDFQ